jgi:hypothetical protein
LIPAGSTEKLDKTLPKDAKKVIEDEREYASSTEFMEALKGTDQSCEGGG